jgi:hypothetical protein
VKGDNTTPIIRLLPCFFQCLPENYDGFNAWALEAIQGAFVGALAVEVGPGGAESFEEFLGSDLACLALVLASAAGHAGDAVVFVAVEPGLNGAPGEAARVALLVEESHGGDAVDAFVACSPEGSVDGAQDAHLQINRRQFHEVSCARFGSWCGSWRTKVDWSKSASAQQRQDALLPGCMGFAATGGARCAGNWVTIGRDMCSRS